MLGFTKMNILVVDDDKDLCELVKNYFEDKHNSVTIALDGKQGYNWLDSFDYDIVFSDVEMPVMSGAEMYAHFISVPRWNHPVFVFMSGNNRYRNCIPEGSGFIEKPFKLHELDYIVDYWGGLREIID